MTHTCKALVVHCMDFRFEQGMFEFLTSQGLLGQADIVGWAGAGKAFLNDKSQEFALEQVELSHKLHSMSEVHIIQHMDCGGYGGSEQFENHEKEYEFQEGQIQSITSVIKNRFPGLQVYGYIADKHGDVVDITPVKKAEKVPA